MKKLDFLEQKIMLAGRLALILLGLIFLVCAIWWAALTIPNGWRHYMPNNNGSIAQRVAGLKPDAKVFEASVRRAQIEASGLDENAVKLQDAMKRPDIAAHYDSIIRRIRAFADSKPEARVRIDEAGQDDAHSVLAPAEFEAIDKYSFLCNSDSGAVTATDALEHCGKQTVRGIIASNVKSLLHFADNDEEEAALHKAFLAGLDQSVSAYLDSKTPRDDLFALPSATISSTLISSFETTFSEKLRALYVPPSRKMNQEMERLSQGVTPLTLLVNPFMIGTVLFLVVFVNLMMMLAVIRIGRRLDQNPGS